MHKPIVRWFTCATVLACAFPVFAGGFFLITGNPEASPKARSANAVLTIKAAGCGNPNDASVSATAIGMVNGHRQTIPLKLVRLDEPGTFAVAQQWPAEGRWVLQFVGTDHDRVTHTLVPAGPNGINRNASRQAMRAPAETDIAALLDAGK